MKYNIGDLFVLKANPTIAYPAIGYVIRIENGEYIIKWFGKFLLNNNEGCYLPEQLKRAYIHYPVKE